MNMDFVRESSLWLPKDAGRIVDGLGRKPRRRRPPLLAPKFLGGYPCCCNAVSSSTPVGGPCADCLEGVMPGQVTVSLSGVTFEARADDCNAIAPDGYYDVLFDPYDWVGHEADPAEAAFHFYGARAACEAAKAVTAATEAAVAGLLNSLSVTADYNAGINGFSKTAYFYHGDVGDQCAIFDYSWDYRDVDPETGDPIWLPWLTGLFFAGIKYASVVVVIDWICGNPGVATIDLYEGCVSDDPITWNIYCQFFEPFADQPCTGQTWTCDGAERQSGDVYADGTITVHTSG